jgi:S-adenosylmethionine:tRNA ribosyltransferase-isomerase
LTPESLRTADFDYALPPELIAQEPLADRGASRLLIVRRDESREAASLPAAAREVHPASGGLLVDSEFARLEALIPPGDLLVLNTTRVRHARLLGTRPSGAPAEVLLVHPAADGGWIALGKPGSALQPGRRIALDADVAVETLEVLGDGHRRVTFVGATAEEAIRRFGRLPLPPYITRDPTDADEQRYQTVYAREEGSVAAPTAGLHFTPALLDRLSAKGVLVAGLDLQVGPGTFKPVDVEDPADHPMHPERYEISPRLAALLELVREREGRVWAVGTTVVRALESAAAAIGGVPPPPAPATPNIKPGFS